MNCKICESNSEYRFSKDILSKYKADYYRCTSCGFMFVNEPSWLEEAYSSAIASTDTGLVYRNIEYTSIVSLLLKFYFGKEQRYLDYGSGYGLFVRLMRDKGFNFFGYDLYCENIFSPLFQVKSEHSGEKYGLVVAMEVFEHLLNPREELEKMFRFSDSVFFTTLLAPEKIREDWWYLAPETGQHISFFTRSSLEYIAKENNLNYYTNGSSYHIFTKKKISPFLFKLIGRKKAADLLHLFMNFDSLVQEDYDAARKRVGDGSRESV